MAGISSSDEGVSVAPEDASTQSNIPVDGAEWVELFVREMMSATSMDDARSRASRVLESLERSISARVGAEAAESFTKVGKNCLLHLTSLLMHKSACAVLQLMSSSFCRRTRC